jgi:basic amino acid/polyamine antiporter, APA family
VIGIRESARFNDVIVAVKRAVIFLFLVPTAPHFSTANWATPENPDGLFIPPNAGTGIYGWSGVVRGAAVVFFAYIGFDAVSSARE